ncbi:MAG: glycosyl hydrolase 115 family protein [Clostridia bacterium]|nr:glycosyl hydrolase 115 family protein [Clostridia bacterium]
MFCLNHQTPVCVSTEESKAVLLAVEDLKRDLCRLLDGAPTPGQEMPAICIATAPEGAFGVMPPEKYESFAVSVSEKGVRIVGSDALGTIYGIYDFEEKCLGIDPMMQFSDLFPACRKEICLEDIFYTDAPGCTRYRGWFLNDEDLLTDFKAGGGTREIDYPFYDHVMHPDVLNMVIESALRCKINLLIPSSFVDIMNPDEERLIRAVTDRGLYITQHHVEPMGVSWFSAARYMKKQGLPENVSFLSNREKMEEIWREYAKRWAKYRNHVIWQLGLRGKADRAVWKSDSTIPMDGASRGAIITDAIGTQYHILREVLGTEDFASTMTLWLEGAELYGKGYLKVPEGVTVIFSDIGQDQMFGEDFFATPRLPGHTYGVYYHAGFWGNGPHLAEACHPEKMRYSYALAKGQNSLYYSILNVANLREMHRSAHLNAAIVRDPDAFDFDRYMRERYAFLFGNAGEKVLRETRRYYDAFADMGEEAMQYLCKRDNFYYHRYEKLPFKHYVATDGVFRSIARDLFRGRERLEVDCREGLIESAEKFEALCADWRKLRDELPENAREYFDIYYLLQAEHMLCMTRWICAYLPMHRVRSEGGDWKPMAQTAAEPLRRILELRKIAARGKWQGWYNGDKKIGVEALIRLTTENIY